VPERILKLSSEIADTTKDFLGDLGVVTRSTQILSVNARIEAAHAGAHGVSFAVVAEEMTRLASDIKRIADDYRESMVHRVGAMDAIGSGLVQQIRGARLADRSQPLRTLLRCAVVGH